MVLTAGAYRFTSAAQLTGTLTLDAENNPDAQFVFKITSALTTAPASAVVLVRGASPCNVYWQVGSDATLDTTTAFQGNLMAYSSISLNNGATVQGRVLARNGQVSLINNVINGSMCTTPPTTPTPTTNPATSDTAPSADTAPQAPPSSRSTVRTRNGTAILRRTPGSPGSPGSPRTPGSPREACTAGFGAKVRGRQIERVVFRLDGKRIATRNGSPFEVLVRAAPGRHTVSARVTFKDATRAVTRKLAYRACAAAVLQPRPGPSRVTG